MCIPYVSSIFRKISPETFGLHCVLEILVNKYTINFDSLNKSSLRIAVREYGF